MEFPFSLFSPFNQLRNPVFPLYYVSHQQVQPTTVLIQNFNNSALSNRESELKLSKSTSNNTNHSRSLEPAQKHKVSKEGKQIKKISAEKRDESFGCRNQNKDRNMLSSILKGYVHFILHNRGMVEMIEKLSKKLGIENGVSAFYNFMAQTFPPKKSYIGIQYIQDVLKEAPENREMRHILGVTLQRYLKEVYLLSLYQNRKLKKKMRQTLLKKARQIIQQIFQQ